MLNHIVVGVDFSPESEAAVAQAMAVARRAGARLTLLHVGAVPDAPLGVPESMAATAAAYTQVVKQQLAEDRDALEALRERLLGQGVEVFHAVYDGFADTGIVEAAKELEADLIVVGTHGRTGLKRFILGSVAERVVRLASVPVLVARATDAPLAGGYAKLLVPTDFSASAEEALELAQALAAEDATIHLLHAWQLPPMSSASSAPVKAADDLFGEVRRSITNAVDETGEQLVDRHVDGGANLSFESVEGSPAHAIQEAIARHQPDVVVLGSHGRRGVTRLLLGSVAENTVRHAPCSVVVVHGTGAGD
ncbi:MAG TPA: universal stress protein [Kofleriaceae bacterium]|nr:universal stress protein [Kofleriaceae bacterium]